MRTILVVTTAVLLIGCAPATDAPSAPRVSASILDAARGGKQHFYWLPPLVASPSTSGVVDGAVSPTVWITEGPSGRIIAEFQARLEAGSDHYAVEWHTALFDLDVQLSYRIHVRVGPTELGHADVEVVSSGGGLKNVDTEEFVALLDGRTLPIKFRVEQGWRPAEVTIVPSAARTGEPFTITDPQGRIRPGSLALFFDRFADPSLGVPADNVVISADGTTLTGTVPNLSSGDKAIAVREGFGTTSYFNDLLFLVP